MCMAIPMDRHLHMRSALQGSQNRLLAVVAGVLLFAWFLFLVSGGLRCWFDADDLMNMCYYWTKPWSALLKANLAFWSSYYRPAGGLFYRSIYALWGFHPLPFRIAVLALLPVNFALLALVVWQFTKSYWGVLIVFTPCLASIPPSRQYTSIPGIFTIFLAYAFFWGDGCPLPAYSPGRTPARMGRSGTHLWSVRGRAGSQGDRGVTTSCGGIVRSVVASAGKLEAGGIVALDTAGGLLRSYRRTGRYCLCCWQEIRPGFAVAV